MKLRRRNLHAVKSIIFYFPLLQMQTFKACFSLTSRVMTARSALKLCQYTSWLCKISKRENKKEEKLCEERKTIFNLWVFTAELSSADHTKKSRHWLWDCGHPERISLCCVDIESHRKGTNNSKTMLCISKPDIWQLHQNLDVSYCDGKEEEPCSVVSVTQPSQSFPLASTVWIDERRRIGESLCGHLTHHVRAYSGKGSTCWCWEVSSCILKYKYCAFGPHLRNNYSISSHSRGMQGEIPTLWVVSSHLPPPYGFYFTLPFPPQQGNFLVCVVVLREEVTELCLFKLCCSVRHNVEGRLKNQNSRFLQTRV